MSCRRAQEIDWAGFLVEPGSPAFDGFRLHYPTCPECARAVAQWNALEADLAALAGDPDDPAGGGRAHPDPEALARHLETAGAADAEHAQHARVAAHLATCAVCREELRALSAFAAEAAGSAPAPIDLEQARRQRRGWQRLAWSPALAAVLAGVLLLPVLYLTIPDGRLAPTPPPPAGQTAARAPTLESAPAPAASPGADRAANRAANRAATQAGNQTADRAAEAELGKSMAESASKRASEPGLDAIDRDQAIEGPSPGAPAEPARAPQQRAKPSARAKGENTVLSLEGPLTVVSARQAAATRSLRVALPPAFGESQARIVSGPDPGALSGLAAESLASPPPRPARLRAERSQEAAAGRADSLEEGARAADAADAVPEAESRDEVEAKPVEVAIPAGSFPGPGSYRVEIRSRDEPGLGPRIFRVEVRPAAP